MSKKILMVVTAADSLTMRDGSEHPTGYWAEELAASHKAFRDAGLEVHIATPGGTKPTIDQVSLDPDNAGGEDRAAELKAYLDSIGGELEQPHVLADVDASEFDAIFIPGGHGPMTDLAFDADLGRMLVEADAREQIIAPLCHGPAALLSAKKDDGSFAFAGRRLTVFSDEEERNGGTGENTPWFVEERLREQGAHVEPGDAFSSVVVVDGNLISGQNPQSSVDAANAVLTALGADVRA